MSIVGKHGGEVNTICDVAKFRIAGVAENRKPSCKPATLAYSLNFSFKREYNYQAKKQIQS